MKKYCTSGKFQEKALWIPGPFSLHEKIVHEIVKMWPQRLTPVACSSLGALPLR